MLNEIKHNFNGEDFFCFLDIDEYWFTPNMSIKIGEYLNQPKFKKADMISFPWAYQEGDKDEFLPPFKNQKIYFGGPKNNRGIANNVKSFIRSTSIEKILRIKPHSCDLIENSIHLFHDGEKFQPFCGSSTKEQTVLKDDLGYFLHRIKRSEKEYLALLLNNTFHGELIKTLTTKALHRKSYKINVKKIVLENQNKDYFNFLEDRLLQKKELIKAIDLARVNKLNTIDKFLQVDNDLILNNLSGFLIKTFGTFLFNDVIARISDKNFNWNIDNEKKVTEVELCLEFLESDQFALDFKQLIDKMRKSLPKN